MRNEKMQVNFSQGVTKAELLIREVKDANELPVKEPVKVAINGTIGAPLEFLTRRMDQQDQVNQKRCHILVNRDKISLSLVINENDFYNTGTVTGKLEFNPKFIEFGINTGKVWTPTELGLFIKMNRSFFTDKAVNMKLVSELMNFTATVNNSIQRSASENGNRTDNFEQVVNSNLPKSFELKIPIFKGKESELVEVETFANINGRDVAFILMSPGAMTVQEDIRDSVLDDQIKSIRAICPDIAIIEI